nr:hypothetical protein [Tanacetum cinerariifolium]
MAPLPPTDQRHPWLRYEDERYTPGIVYSYEQRLETIWSRLVNRVYVLDFAGLTPEMRHDLVVRLRMVYSGEGQQEMAESGFGAYWVGSDRLILDKGGLRDYWIKILSGGDFFGPAPSYVLIRDPVRRLCHRMIAYSISGRGMHLGRARLSGGHFIGRLDMHFGLAAAAGTHVDDEAGPAAEEVAEEIPAPAQAPPPLPQPRTMSQRIERVEEEIHDLRHDIVGLRAHGRQRPDYQPFDGTLVGSSRLSFQRRVRPRTGDASTSAAPHTDA